SGARGTPGRSRRPTWSACRDCTSAACLGRDPVAVVLVRILDFRRDDVAGLEPAGVAQMDLAVDLRRVGLGAAGGADAVMMLRMGSVEVPPLPAVAARQLSLSREGRGALVDAVDQ